MNYKRIGDYIELVDERNKELKVTTLLGLSISKQFIPSVANTIGTNMKNYKIIRKNQFACSIMQVRRDGKMPVALLKDFDKAIISQAYPVFQVIDEEQLLPDYLMMWFTRSEFDRQATFHAVGGVRGSLEWEDFLDFELPIPSIEKQKQIVAEYNTVTNRIQLNEKINTNLEATAQALYKHWFVDFEFPYVTSSGVEMPYKSSGGKMVYNEELDKEIPVGWGVEKFSTIYKIKAGGDKPYNASSIKTELNQIPIYANGVTDDGLVGFSKKATISKKAITISARGTIGFAFLRLHPFIPIVRLITLIPNDEEYLYYLYRSCINYDFTSSGSVQSQLTKPNISLMKKLIPPKKSILKYNLISEQLLKRRLKNNEMSEQLKELQSILLAKMTQVAPKTEAV